jgi:hypothetical protein
MTSPSRGDGSCTRAARRSWYPWCQRTRRDALPDVVVEFARDSLALGLERLQHPLPEARARLRCLDDQLSAPAALSLVDDDPNVAVQPVQEPHQPLD